MGYYLGVDIGNSKSHALVTDEQGRVAGFAQGGPGNYETAGWEGFRTTLPAASAAEAAGIGIKDMAAAGMGIAGYDWPSEARPIGEVITTLGLRAPVALVNDAMIGLLAGAVEGWGVVVAAGTSVNCWGRDRSGREGRIIGYGGLYGEHAGAWELVQRAVIDVGTAWTRRGPATALTEAFLQLTGARDETALFEGLTLGRLAILPSAAPLVFALAAGGDAVAAEAVRWAGSELGNLAVGVVRQLGIEALAFDIVLSGSFFEGGPELLPPLEAAVRAEAPQARLVRLETPPVTGAVLLAMQQAGIDCGIARLRLLETAVKLIAEAPAPDFTSPQA